MQRHLIRQCEERAPRALPTPRRPWRRRRHGTGTDVRAAHAASSSTRTHTHARSAVPAPHEGSRDRTRQVERERASAPGVALTRCGGVQKTGHVPPLPLPPPLPPPLRTAQRKGGEGLLQVRAQCARGCWGPGVGVLPGLWAVTPRARARVTHRDTTLRQHRCARVVEAQLRCRARGPAQSVHRWLWRGAGWRRRRRSWGLRGKGRAPLRPWWQLHHSGSRRWTAVRASCRQCCGGRHLHVREQDTQAHGFGEGFLGCPPAVCVCVASAVPSRARGRSAHAP
jgi:hypothetical protein